MVAPVMKNIPDGIDYSLFKWLKRGVDYQWIAEKSKVGKSMVSATIRKRAFNADVILWASKRAVERMQPVLQAQAEAKRMQQLIEVNRGS